VKHLYGISALGCVFILVISLVFIGMFSQGGGSLLHNADATELNIDPSTFTDNTNFSTVVPTNFATLFKDAGSKTKVPASLIAAIYLTEHHTDTFGKDIPSLNARDDDCETSFAGAVGPMQITNSTWSSPARALESQFGITAPDRCRYYDAFLAAGLVIKGKTTWHPAIKKACTFDASGNVADWNDDDCIEAIGMSYCGACTGKACGTNGFNYCEQTLRHYKMVQIST